MYTFSLLNTAEPGSATASSTTKPTDEIKSWYHEEQTRSMRMRCAGNENDCSDSVRCYLSHISARVTLICVTHILCKRCHVECHSHCIGKVEHKPHAATEFRTQ